MSVSAASRTPDPVRSKVTWVRTLRGEAIRFWALRGNRWALLAALLSSAALASISTAFWSDGESPLPEAGHTVEALSGLVMTQIVVGVLGALTMASEYGTGSISATTLAVPRRHWTLSAKAVVLTSAVLPVGLAGGTLSFLVTGALLDRRGHPVQSIADPGVVGSLVGSALYLTAVTLIGLGVGALIRSTAGSVVIVTAGIYLLPELARMILPGSWQGAVVARLPSVAGEALWSPIEDPDLLSGPLAAVTLAAWAGALLLAGGTVMMRRDT